MKSINRDEYDAMIAGGEQLIVGSEDGLPMVVQLEDGIIVKRLPFQKKLSAKFFPRALRFKRNCEKLRKLGIKTPTVLDLYEWSNERCHIIRYQGIPGLAVAEYLDSAEYSRAQKLELLLRVASYYAKLHELGAYCRPSHFRNIIVNPNGDLGLIDVQNIRVRRRSLSSRARARNFKHIFSHKKDLEQVGLLGIDKFFARYCETSNLARRKRRKFHQFLLTNSEEICAALEAEKSL